MDTNLSEVKHSEIEFSELIEQNQKIIHRICRIYTSNSMDSQDLFQEILLQLWKSYGSFRGNSKFTTWMYRVALNTALSLFRKSKKNVVTQEFDNASYTISESLEEAEKEEQIELLYRIIKRLPEVERAFILLYLDNLSYKEISDTMGITEINCRVKLNRIKNKLKELMTQDE
ncbi:MAG: RNA polymerase sigma factor [Flavobacteriaceae bacterium]|nr:RNA polymerase sigma factor [Flavobacteriaceae bacterium]